MKERYVIGPSIGVARLGDSADSFYVAPDDIGALPIECDERGDVKYEGRRPQRVMQFKDGQSGIRRQAAIFRVYRLSLDHPEGEELFIGHPDVESLVWTVHLANKKAAWYNFAELQGNLLYGPANSYEKQGVSHRNSHIHGERRKALIVDPGPRSLDGPNQKAEFDRDAAISYPHASFPEKNPTFGQQIDTLGEMRTDSQGRLLVLGGFGKSGGNSSISSFAGGDSWHDDTSDGPVTCILKIRREEKPHFLTAWCIVGSPKFAPELINIVTLDDTMWDVAVRHLNASPDLFVNGNFRGDFMADFDRDIAPILNRPGAYRWVANTPAMNSLSPPPFDARDSSAAMMPIRKAYLQHFRKPSPENAMGQDANALFLASSGFPLLPLNSGSNSVSDVRPDKFLTLTETQYFYLNQWAEGRFTLKVSPKVNIPTALSRGALGNCVGGPFCPGIEVTWSTRNPNIYSEAFAIRHRQKGEWYEKHGLDPEEDETAAPAGCEPGDLTKRMAIPWQADFFQCSIQYITFTDDKTNKSDDIPAPPSYYAYWWPPQSPWLVITGDLDSAGQQAAGTPAGLQVLYARGINTFAQMIAGWSYMGFVVNVASDAHRLLFPYFVEQERNHQAFITAAIAIGDSSNVSGGEDTNFSNAWFLPAPTPAKRSPVTFATSRRHGRVALGD